MARRAASDARIIAMPLGGGLSSLSILFDDLSAEIHLNASRESRARHLADGAALFMTFADVEPTAEGIARFRQQEFLIADTDITVIDETSLTTVMRVHAQGHNVPPNQRWKEEILALRPCIHLWTLIQNGNIEELSRNIRWESNAHHGLQVIYDSHPDLNARKPAPPPEVKSTSVIASQLVNPDLMGKLSAGDTIVPASLYLARQIKARLTDGTYADTFATLARPARGHALPPTATYLVPKNVLFAVWLQFSEAIQEHKRFERCRECKSWIELSLTKHKDRQYCSDLCKVNAYRARKEAAWRYYLEGKKFNEIAKLVGSDAETVKGWIASMQKEK